MLLASRELACQMRQASVSASSSPKRKPWIPSRSTATSTTSWHQLVAKAANISPNASRNFDVANCSRWSPS